MLKFWLPDTKFNILYRGKYRNEILQIKGYGLYLLIIFTHTIFKMSLALKLPFDEAAGTFVAYDYSGNNHHAAVANGRFIKGRSGNCIYFPSSGRAEIFPKILNLNQNFTMMCWMKAELTPFGPNKTWVLLRFANARYMRLEFNSTLESWTHISMTREGSTIRTYAGNRQIDSEDIPSGWGICTGYAILNNNGYNDAGHCYLDEFQFLDGEVLRDFSEIIYSNIMIAPVYSINGIDFKSFGVTVEKSKGIIDELSMKDPMKFDWEGYHGEVIDLLSISYETREIELDCWLLGNGREDFAAQFSNFKSQFRGPHTKRLMLKLIEKPLVYEVYNPNKIEMTETDWVEGDLVGRFTLKLREPEPVKRVLKFTKNDTFSTITVTVSSKKMLSIYWGDGTRDRNIYGANKTISHTYTEPGDYYPVIAGVIEEITFFDTNAVIVWTIS